MSNVSTKSPEKTELQLAFERYDEHDLKVTALKAQLDAAEDERSAIVRVISSMVSDRTFLTPAGKVLTLVCRREKDDEGKVVKGGKETYFFKSPKGGVKKL